LNLLNALNLKQARTSMKISFKKFTMAIAVLLAVALPVYASVGINEAGVPKCTATDLNVSTGLSQSCDGSTSSIRLGDASGNLQGTGATTSAGYARKIVADADGKTLTAAECGTIQTNTGAASPGIWNLPEASTVPGCDYIFLTTAGVNWSINPDNADIILSLTNAAGDSIRNSTVGNSVALVATSGVNWQAAIVAPTNGTWADVN